MSICYVVATPIGNLEDLSPRALQILKTVDVICAEDTRHSGKLLSFFGISTRMLSLHQCNERERIEEIKGYLSEGKSIALISDAGTPLISDPGFPLVRALRKDDISIIPIPGACALIAALSVSGIATDRFVFEGFLPAKLGARRQYLDELKEETRTLIFYESSHRILEMLSDCIEYLSAERYAFIGREMTKHYESYMADSLINLLRNYKESPDTVRGEFVIVIEGAPKKNKDSHMIATDFLLETLLEALPLKQAVAVATKLTGIQKNQLYQQALVLHDKGEN